MRKVDLNVLFLGLFSVLPICLLICSILFGLGYSINGWVFPLAILGGMAIIFRKLNKSRFLFATLLTYFVIIVLFITVATLTMDPSWDGNSYHKDIISSFVIDGWSPFYNHHAPNPGHPMWTDHYAKGMELMAATVYATTGLIESGKAINFILILSALLSVYCILAKYWPSFSCKKRLFYTLTISFSTIVAGQFLTYQLDFAMYCVLLILTRVLLYIKEKMSFENIFVFSSCIVLLISMKFNFAFWGAVLISGYLIVLCIKRQKTLFSKVLGVGLISGFVGFCLVNYNPYITNLIDHGTPIYPLLGGSDSVDILYDQLLTNYQGNPEWINVFISLFSHMGGDPGGTTSFCPPLYFAVEDIVYYLGGTSRAAGFGIWFSAIMLFSLFVWGFTRLSSRDRKESLIILLLVFLSLFLLPGSWWARYVPFFYIFPFIALLYSERGVLTRPLLFLRRFTFLLIAGNILLAVGTNIASNISYISKMERSINVIRKCDNPQLYFGICKNVGYKIFLDEQGIRYEEVSEMKDGMVSPYSSPPVYYLDEK